MLFKCMIQSLHIWNNEYVDVEGLCITNKIIDMYNSFPSA